MNVSQMGHIGRTGQTALMTSAEAAKRLSVSVSTFHREVASGGITPVFKAPGLRGAYMFDSADVEALAQARAR